MHARDAAVSRLIGDWKPEHEGKAWFVVDQIIRDDRVTLLVTNKESQALGAEPFKLYLEPKTEGGKSLTFSGHFLLSYSTSPALEAAAFALTHSLARHLKTTEEMVDLHEIFGRETLLRKDLDGGEVRINRRCNEKCLFCNSRGFMENDSRGREHVLETIRSIADKGIKLITITGWEPTLEPELEEYISEARALGLETIILQSNGLTLTDLALCTRLRDAGLTHVNLSCHGVDPEVAAKLTGVAGDAEAKVIAASNMLSLGVAVELNMVLTSLNMDQGAKLVRLAGDLMNRAGGFASERRRWWELMEQVDLPTTSSPYGLDFFPGTPAGMDEAEQSSPLTVLLSQVAPNFDDLELRSRLIPRYSEVLPHVQEALVVARDLQVPMAIPLRCGYPLCMLGPARRLVHTYRRRIEVPVPETHLKLETCKGCLLSDWCEGIWRGYVELHGGMEMIIASRDFKSLE